jgi:hypothetical protein
MICLEIIGLIFRVLFNFSDIGNYMCRTGDGRLNATIKVRSELSIVLSIDRNEFRFDKSSQYSEAMVVFIRRIPENQL